MPLSKGPIPEYHVPLKQYGYTCVASVANTASTAADTDILSSDITPSNEASMFVVYVQMVTSRALNATISVGGSEVLDVHLNSGSAIPADVYYGGLLVPCPRNLNDVWNTTTITGACTINFQVTGGGSVIQFMNVYELHGMIG